MLKNIGIFPIGSNTRNINRVAEKTVIVVNPLSGRGSDAGRNLQV
jgi:hypothetical protein